MRSPHLTRQRAAEAPPTPITASKATKDPKINKLIVDDKLNVTPLSKNKIIKGAGSPASISTYFAMMEENNNKRGQSDSKKPSKNKRELDRSRRSESRPDKRKHESSSSDSNGRKEKDKLNMSSASHCSRMTKYNKKFDDKKFDDKKFDDKKFDDKKFDDKKFDDKKFDDKKSDDKKSDDKKRNDKKHEEKKQSDEPMSESENERNTAGDPLSSSEEEGELPNTVDPPQTEPISSEGDLDSAAMDVSDDEPQMDKPEPRFTMGPYPGKKSISKTATLKRRLKNKAKKPKQPSPSLIKAFLSSDEAQTMIKEKQRNKNGASMPPKKKLKLEHTTEEDNALFEEAREKEELALFGLLKRTSEKIGVPLIWNQTKLDRYHNRHGLRFITALKLDLKDFTDDLEADPNTVYPPFLKREPEITSWDPEEKEETKLGDDERVLKKINVDNTEVWSTGDEKKFQGFKWNGKKFEDVKLASQIKTTPYGLLGFKQKLDIKAWNETLLEIEKSPEYMSFGIMSKGPNGGSFEFRFASELNFETFNTWLETRNHAGGQKYSLTLEIRIEQQLKAKPDTKPNKPKTAPSKLKPGEWRMKIPLPMMQEGDDDDPEELVKQFFADNHLTGTACSPAEAYQDKKGYHYLGFNISTPTMAQVYKIFKDYKRACRWGNNRMAYTLGRFLRVQADYNLKGCKEQFDLDGEQ